MRTLYLYYKSLLPFFTAYFFLFIHIGPFAPIRTQDADVVLELIESKDNTPDTVVSSSSIRLRELSSQQTMNKVLNMPIRREDGSSGKDNTTGRLFVSFNFQYSKVVPIRNNIYEVQDKIRHVDKSLQDIRR
jgi:hypothetical protein